MKDKVTMRAQAGNWNQGIEFQVTQGDHVATLIEMQRIEKGREYQPVLRIDKSEAQTLMDDLWIAGIRPTEGSGSAGSLRATEKHLEDMRKIAFIGIEKELG